MRATKSIKEPEPAEPRQVPVAALPMFLAHCLFDGDSYAFYGFIAQRIHVLGAAWGYEIVGRRIERAQEHDACYASMRSAQREEKDRQLADQWPELIRQYGSERNWILAETANYVKILGIQQHDLPCIACEAGVDSRRFAILRIRPEWYATDEKQRILSECLQSGLGSRTVRTLIPTLPMSPSELAERMQLHLDRLALSIARRMRGLDELTARQLSEAEVHAAAQRHPLVLDLRGHRAFQHGQLVELTDMPFRLLTALAEVAISQGAILSRDDASARVWGGESRSDHTLDSLVRRLRETFGAARRSSRGTPPIEIEVVRGRGWRLKLDATEVLVV